MSSIKPDHGRDKMDGAQKIEGGFVVACCDHAILFEPSEEVFNQVTRVVDVAIEASRLFRLAF